LTSSADPGFWGEKEKKRKGNRKKGTEKQRKKNKRRRKDTKKKSNQRKKGEKTKEKSKQKKEGRKGKNEGKGGEGRTATRRGSKSRPGASLIFFAGFFFVFFFVCYSGDGLVRVGAFRGGGRKKNVGRTKLEK